jgi:poly-gamma-glutamate capsule biosynthesis protein CapA/YwtB (metallophosphatase superfamily)
MLTLLLVLAAAPDAGMEKPNPAPAPAPEKAKAALAAGPALRVRAVGDVMMGSSIPSGHLPPDDGAHLLDAVAPLLKDADLTFANLEGPLCDEGESNKCHKGGNCFAFRTPTAWGKYLKQVGIDVVSSANNHVADFGEECRRSTERTLDALGIKWSGPPGSVAELVANGLKVAVIAFHTSNITNDVNDLPAAKALVAKVKADHQVVIVSFHGGAEGTNATHVFDGAEMFLHENRGDLKPFAHGVIDAGADLVIGHGPHVLRGLEVYQGHLIAYSLGNFATYGRFSLGGPLAISGVLEVELKADGTLLKGRVYPTRQEGLGVPQPDDKAQGIALLQQLTREDFPKTGPTIAADGAITP